MKNPFTFICCAVLISVSECFNAFTSLSAAKKLKCAVSTQLMHATPTSIYLDTLSLQKRGKNGEVEYEKHEETNNLPRKTVIIGGGPSGLATAIMLARRGYKNIQVYERLSRPPAPDSKEWGDPDRSYMLGLGGRGQTSLAKLGVYEKVAAYCGRVTGRMDASSKYPEPVIQDFTERKYKTRTLSRDRLVSCLLEEVESMYSDAVTVHFNIDCMDVQWKNIDKDDEKVQLTLVPSTDADKSIIIKADFVVGADGVRSAVKAAMEENSEIVKAASGKSMKTVRFDNTNERVYKTIQLRIPADWSVERNYCASSPGGVNFEALPNFEGALVGLVLYRPGNSDIEGIKTMEQAKDFFQSTFPGFVKYFSDEDLEKFAQKPASKLPLFCYCGPVLHVGKSTVLLGDTIKTVKPYFGIGVNSAFEDICILNDCLEKSNDDRAIALPQFSRKRAPSAKALVELSRGFDSEGWRQAVLFILPIILDGIFSKALPKIFKPNTIQLLQVPEAGSFAEVRRRKWVDRVMQLTVLSSLLRVFYLLAKCLFKRLVPLALGR